MIYHHICICRRECEKDIELSSLATIWYAMHRHYHSTICENTQKKHTHVIHLLISRTVWTLKSKFTWTWIKYLHGEAEDSNFHSVYKFIIKASNSTLSVHEENSYQATHVTSIHTYMGARLCRNRKLKPSILYNISIQTNWKFAWI